MEGYVCHVFWSLPYQNILKPTFLQRGNCTVESHILKDISVLKFVTLMAVEHPEQRNRVG